MDSPDWRQRAREMRNFLLHEGGRIRREPGDIEQIAAQYARASWICEAGFGAPFQFLRPGSRDMSIAVLEGHTSEVTSAAFDPAGRRIVSASYDDTLRLWDAGTGETQRVLEGHTDTVNSAAFDPEGRRIVSASEDHTLRLWDAETGEQIARLPLWCAAISAAWHPLIPNRLMIGLHDGTVHVVDYRG
jgi:WD40 repeat protein